MRGRTVSNATIRHSVVGSFVVVALSVIVLSAVAPAPAVAQGAAIAPDSSTAAPLAFDYPQDPAAVVVSLTEELGALEVLDPGPSLRIYGDGRLVVHYPEYMTRAGDYELWLNRAEMGTLLRSLLARRVVEFDAAAVRRTKRDVIAARRAAAAARTPGQGEGGAVMHATFDASTTRIELRLDRYRPAPPDGAAAVQAEERNVAKAIVWYGLRADAEHYPEIVEIQDLAAAHGELRALFDRTDLMRVE
jgi:hypothetical protein